LKELKHFETISEFHEFRKLPKPLHPLLSIINVADVPQPAHDEPRILSQNFYGISVKRMHNVNIKYGQSSFDFNDGIMSFMSPNQIFSIEVDDKDQEIEKSGWVIYIHPDFIWNTPLASTIKRYDFWSYSLNEALFLFENEEAVVNNMMMAILQEYQSNIDKFSKRIIVSHIQTLLEYADRYYNRQFITREKANHQILERLEKLVDQYFDREDLIEKGLPTVGHIAGELHVSPKYLSNLLRVLAGISAQQYIHDKLIQKAKEKLSTTDVSVSEISYQLGFEHLPSFSKLFKAKTSISPLKFRQSFN
jgi:AraC-like DNA-binding protein